MGEAEATFTAECSASWERASVVVNAMGVNGEGGSQEAAGTTRAGTTDGCERVDLAPWVLLWGFARRRFRWG